MTRKAMFWSLVICTSLALLGSLSAFAQQWSPSPPEKRCPSSWGLSEFAFVVLPLKIKGGTGSTVAPIAMK